MNNIHNQLIDLWTQLPAREQDHFRSALRERVQRRRRRRKP